jgi:hypothetical protein
MAIMKLGTSTVGVVGVTCAGITHPTSASGEKSYGTIVRAKDKDGNICAALVGKASASMTVSGYSTTGTGPELGGAINAGGVSGKVISVSIEKSVEDFSKFTAEGRGLA